MAQARRAKAARVSAPGTRRRGVTYDEVCELGLGLSGVEEGLSFGTPALKVQGRLLVRLKEDGETLVLRVDLQERERLLAADPRVFYVTDHYLNYPAVLVRLPAVRRTVMRQLLEYAWRFVAPERLVSGAAAAISRGRRPSRRR